LRAIRRLARFKYKFPVIVIVFTGKNCACHTPVTPEWQPNEIFNKSLNVFPQLFVKCMLKHFIFSKQFSCVVEITLNNFLQIQKPVVYYFLLADTISDKMLICYVCVFLVNNFLLNTGNSYIRVKFTNL